MFNLQLPFSHERWYEISWVASILGNIGYSCYGRSHSFHQPSQLRKYKNLSQHPTDIDYQVSCSNLLCPHKTQTYICCGVQSRSSLQLWGQDPIWALVQVPLSPLPIQVPVNVLRKATANGPGSWVPALSCRAARISTLLGLNWPSSGCCGHSEWGINWQMEDLSVSTCLSVNLPLR